MRTGEDDIYQTAHIVSWEGKTHLDVWDTRANDVCNMINGTDSSYFRPFRTTVDPEPLYTFTTDVCR